MRVWEGVETASPGSGTQGEKVERFGMRGAWGRRGAAAVSGLTSEQGVYRRRGSGGGLEAEDR